MLKKLKFIIYTKAFAFFVYHLIRIYSLTFRFQIINESHWQSLLKQGTPVLLCTWHQHFFSAIRHFKKYTPYNPGLMISRSKDGDLISGVANRTGWHTPRGSSSRGGREALGNMIAHLKQYKFGAHVLDGPRGPIGKVKPGIIKMAYETGTRIIPFYIEASNAWYFNSWDRFMLPKPFSTVKITFGRDFEFISDDDPKTFENHRRDLETYLAQYLVIPR